MNGNLYIPKAIIFPSCSQHWKEASSYSQRSVVVSAAFKRFSKRHWQFRHLYMIQKLCGWVLPVVSRQKMVDHIVVFNFEYFSLNLMLFIFFIAWYHLFSSYFLCDKPVETMYSRAGKIHISNKTQVKLDQIKHLSNSLHCGIVMFKVRSFHFTSHTVRRIFWKKFYLNLTFQKHAKSLQKFHKFLKYKD